MVTTRPYRKTNPRSIRGARKQGWHIVKVPGNTMERFNTSWLGLVMWTTHKTRGNFVNNFVLREFAFETIEDASWFTMKWCI
jgi:hypothetical protein